MDEQRMRARLAGEHPGGGDDESDRQNRPRGCD
jgi:hypothetical protein